MYIAWKNIDNTDSLFKVQLDSDFNYVSHEVLGELKFDTFGLASEQGVLYGVTASEIYRIVLDTSTPTFETVLSNDLVTGHGSGQQALAKLSEYFFCTYQRNRRTKNSNALSNPWTNTVEDSQTIYVRTENITTGNFIVTPVNIEIYPTPFIENNPPDLSSCDTDNDGIVSFDFTSQSTLIMGTQDTSLYESKFYNDIDLSSSISNPSNYQTIEPLETIFFRIINTNNEECFSEGSFNITIAGPDSCNENDPPEISVSGRFPYCPLEQILIAENFNITDSDDTCINQFSIQISSGYASGSDVLSLTGNHPTINASWDITEGKLTLNPVSTTEILYTDLIPAVRSVVFESTDALVSGEKFFSFNIGDANYLPSTDHYYEYVPQNGIDWESARVAAENRTYFGLQGYLATILTTDEVQLSGEQAAGTGWIGGSDRAQEGVWRWVTGPEAGTIFWNGGANGTTPNFAYWNTTNQIIR